MDFNSFKVSGITFPRLFRSKWNCDRAGGLQASLWTNFFKAHKILSGIAGHVRAISNHPSSVGHSRWGRFEVSQLLDGPATRAIHAAKFKRTEFHYVPQAASVIPRLADRVGVCFVIIAGYL